MPLISVIVPAFNAAQTIAGTLRSALAQAHTDLELIVVDDGSTDETAARVRASEDPRVRLLRFANAGQAVARNRGIEQARGELLAFLDADDAWTPDKLAAQVAALEAAPTAGVAYSWTDYIDEQDGFVRHGSHRALGGDVLRAIFQTNFVDSGSNVLVRRSVVERVGGFAAEAVPAEDWDWNLRLAEQAEFAPVPAVGVLYRVRAESQSSDLERMLAAGTLCLQRALERSPQLLAASPSAHANLHRYLLYKLLEEPADSGRTTGTLQRATQLLRGLMRHDASAWRRRATRRAFSRACAFELLPASWMRRLDRRESTWSRLLVRELSAASLLGQIRVR